MKLDTSVWYVLKQKNSDTVWTANPDQNIREAAMMMSKNKIGALLVIDPETNQMLGILSEKECVRRVLTRKADIDSITVADVMEKKIVCVSPLSTVEQCFAIMTEYRVRHLPVIEHGKLIGLISIGDVIKSLVDDQRFAIQQLEQYICGVQQSIEPPAWESWKPGHVLRLDPRHSVAL